MNSLRLGQSQRSLLFRIVGSKSGVSPRCQAVLNVRQKSSSRTKEEEDEDLNKPIKFSTSKAADWKASSSFRGTLPEDQPWIQPLSVIGSMAAIMLYFFVFREENDLDEFIGTSLWDRVPGLELEQLRLVYDYNRERNIDNSAVLARIKFLERQEAAAAAAATSPSRN